MNMKPSFRSKYIPNCMKIFYDLKGFLTNTSIPIIPMKKQITFKENFLNLILLLELAKEDLILP